MQTFSKFCTTHLTVFKKPACKFFSFPNISINKQHKIIPSSWFNKENKYLALLPWVSPDKLRHLIQRKKIADFSTSHLWNFFPWEVHVTTKISWWEKKIQGPDCFVYVTTTLSKFLNTLELIFKHGDHFSNKPVWRDNLINKHGKIKNGKLLTYPKNYY